MLGARARRKSNVGVRHEVHTDHVGVYGALDRVYSAQPSHQVRPRRKRSLLGQAIRGKVIDLYRVEFVRVSASPVVQAAALAPNCRPSI
jgi:hypothetical protein